MPVSQFSLFEEKPDGIVASQVYDNIIEIGQSNSSLKISVVSKWFGDNVLLIRTRQPIIIILNTSNYTFIKIPLKYNVDSDLPEIEHIFNLSSWDELYNKIRDQLLSYGFSYDINSKLYTFGQGFYTPEYGNFEGEHNRSVDLYLGDYVTIKQDIIDIGHSSLKHLKEGIDDEDAVIMRQLVAFKESLNDSIDISKADIININSKIDAILLGSPDILNSFKELIDLVNSLEITTSNNLIAEIYRISTKINEVETVSIAQDITHTKNIADINTLITSNYNTHVANDLLIEGRITAYKASCESELLAEVLSRRENDLQIREEMITVKNISPSISIYTDGMLGNFGGNGYTDVQAHNINGLFFHVPITSYVHIQLPVFKPTMFKDIAKLFCSICILSNKALPKLAVYTKVKKDGTDVSTWYNKALFFEVSNPTSILINNSYSNSTCYQLYADINNNANSIPNYSQKKIRMTLASESSVFYDKIPPNDYVECVTLITEKSKPTGHYEFIVNNIGCSTSDETMVNSFDDIALYYYSKEILNKTERNIYDINTSIINITNEIKTNLDTQIAKQSSDKELLELSIANTKGSLTTSINTEIIRANNAEAALNTKMDTHIENYNTNNVNLGLKLDTIELKQTKDNQSRIDRDVELLRMIKDNEESFLSFVQWFTEVGKYTNVPFKFPHNRKDSTHTFI